MNLSRPGPTPTSVSGTRWQTSSCGSHECCSPNVSGLPSSRARGGIVLLYPSSKFRLVM